MSETAPSPISRADAILCPAHYPPLRPGEDRDYKLKGEFAPVLGSTLVHARGAGLGRATLFLTGHTTMKNGMGVCLHFPGYHPMAGQDRYTWTDRGDGVMYGTLTPEAAADEA